MAVERGLPSVPQGLPRGLTVYLQNLHAYLLRLAGNVRGAADSQAVRRAEIAGYSKSSAPGENSVTAAMVRDGDDGKDCEQGRDGKEDCGCDH